MGIALLTFADLLVPLQSLVHRWNAPRRSRRHPGEHLRHGAVQPGCAGRARDAGPGTAPARPLRVVRLAEPRSSGRAGRLVISGRLADVCAELDRLAALEQPHVADPFEPARRQQG